MAKKILALVSALALIVCAVSVFTVISVSAGSVEDAFKAEIEAYPTVADDWSAYGSTDYLVKSTNADGSVHLEVGTSPDWSRPTWLSKEIAVDGAHIIVKNVYAPKGRFTLGLNADGSNGRTGQVWIIFTAGTGAVSTMNGGWGGEGAVTVNNPDVIKGIFAEGAATSFKMTVAENGAVNLEVTNAAGTDKFVVDHCLGGSNMTWKEGENTYTPSTVKIGFAEWNASLDYVTKLDVVALHGGAEECIQPLDFTPDVDTYGVTADDFSANWGEDRVVIEAGDVGVNINISCASTATIGAAYKEAIVLDGAHIIVGAYTSWDGSAVTMPTISLGGNMYDVFDAGNVVKFDLTEGRVFTYPGAGGDTLIEAGNEVVKAMATMDSCIGFSVDGEGNVWITVTNDAGTAVAEYAISTYGNAWTDHSKAYLYFSNHCGKDYSPLTHNVKAIHGGDKTCAYNADAAGKVIAKIDAIGTVTAASKAAVEAAEKAYALLSNTEKAAVTNYETLTAARAALDVALAAEFDALTDAIGEVVNTEECGAKITAAEEAYAALNAAQKALTTKYDVLTAARATYDEISGKNAADADAAAAMDAVIDALGEVALTDEFLAQLTAAEEAFNALTDAQKALVTKADVLAAARKAYDALVDAGYRYTYNIKVPVASGDFTAHYTSFLDIADNDNGVGIDIWAESGSNWAGRVSYNYQVGFDGLQIVIKDADKMLDTMSFALMDSAGEWTDTTTAKIVWLLYREGGAGYGYLRCHNIGGEAPHSNPLWMIDLNENVWADGELLIEFAQVNETTGTIFIDGQRMGDFGMDDLGLADVNAAYPHFSHWSAGIQSYTVHSITSKSQNDAMTVVVDAINAIGTVDVNDADCVARIEAAEEAYKGLAKNLRKLVPNYEVLEDALAALDGEEVEDPTEEPVETEEPTEEPTEDPAETETPDENPKTGEAVAVLPIALLIAAAGAVVISRKRK